MGADIVLGIGVWAQTRISLDQKLAVQRQISLTEQLKSQLTQTQLLVTRRLVPYIVRDGQWHCGIGPTAPSMTHPQHEE
jgi:hypothetical protein